MFIDTHAHLDFEAYDEDRENVIQKAIEKKVSGIITIGTDVESSKQAVLLSEKYASVFAAVGIHPTDCALAKDKDFDMIKELARHEKVVAIGEIGLDYYHMRTDKKTQKNVFNYQIQMAKELNLPLIIHNRDSHEDLYEIISTKGATVLGGVLHSFSGDEKFLENILLTNFHISFTGNITFKGSATDPLILQTPLDRLLLETDSPFLTPMPLRGKRNEPAFLVHTAKKIAEVKGITVEEVGKITTENAKILFKLNF